MSGRPDREGLSTQFEVAADEVTTRYDEWSATYEDDVIGWGYRVPATIAAMLTVSGSPNGEALDAGCGTGLAGVALAEAGVSDIVGADVSVESLRLAAETGNYRELVEADLTEPLPFEDDRFAAAVSAGVFTYFDDPAAVLRELLRVVRPGGTVIFSQRTDLWDQRDCDAVLEELVERGGCSVQSSPPQPYLPEHPEYGDEIRVIYTALIVR